MREASHSTQKCVIDSERPAEESTQIIHNTAADDKYGFMPSLFFSRIVKRNGFIRNIFRNYIVCLFSNVLSFRSRNSVDVMNHDTISVEDGAGHSLYETGFDKVSDFHKAVEKKIKFNNNVQVRSTWSPTEYDRRGDFMARNLTPEIAMLIKMELNKLKRNMPVHKDSHYMTHYYSL